MTKVIPLAGRRAAPYSSTTDTTDPETIRLHVQAENALSTALHELRRLDATPTTLRVATNRAIRAATLLKRASEGVPSLPAPFMQSPKAKGVSHG